MDFLEVLLNRHSTRSFKEQSVEKEKIERLLKAATYAPNGRHLNTWQFTVLQDKEKMNILAKTIVEVLDRDPDYDFYSPDCLIIVSDRRDDVNVLANCACALQNIFLMAEYEGLSSVWINQLKTICDNPKIRKLLTSFGIPEDHLVGGMAAIGYEDKAANAQKNSINTLVELELKTANKSTVFF